MSLNEIIESVAYANYDDFQHLNFIFSQNFISLFSLHFISFQTQVDPLVNMPSEIILECT
jgi:hypothetical protein